MLPGVCLHSGSPVWGLDATQQGSVGLSILLCSYTTLSQVLGTLWWMSCSRRQQGVGWCYLVGLCWPSACSGEHLKDPNPISLQVCSSYYRDIRNSGSSLPCSHGAGMLFKCQPWRGAAQCRDVPKAMCWAWTHPLNPSN